MAARHSISVDWQAFASLEGAPTRNFETLCRAIVARRFQRYGVLSNYRNQAGVEFTLLVNTEGELGDAGRRWGWQCKWYYPLPQTKTLNKTRKEEIADAVAKAEASADSITDFVLCLPQRPKSGDIQWYFELSSTMKLHLWADEDFEAQLVGAAAEVRSTFFGELVLSSQDVLEAHTRSVAPIHDRWFREVHTVSSVEDSLKRLLLRPGSMPQLTAYAQRLAGLRDRLTQTTDLDGEGAMTDAVQGFSSDITVLSNQFSQLSNALEKGNLDHFALEIGSTWTPETEISQVRSLGRALRKIRSPSALDVAAAEIEVCRALRLRDELRQEASPSVVAIVADAGKGKTQLAAAITGSDPERPGIFIRAAQLSAGNGLDDLTKRIPRLGLSTFDDLVRASDALGQRAGYRVPIVIDGLNESQRPADWKSLLGEAIPFLEQHSNVVLILTMRGAVLDECLPSKVGILELDWDNAPSERLIQRYFDYYKIQRGRIRIPRGLFDSPLFLKLYCEATNPARDQLVGPERYPTSLSEVFSLYRKAVADRLRNQPGHPAFQPGHIERKLGDFAQAIWVGGRRTIPYDTAPSLLDDAGVAWDHSLLRRLEEEGVLHRDDIDGVRHAQTGILYDALAGHLVADSILSSTAARDWHALLSDQTLWSRIAGDGAERHELADDILLALVGLVPRYGYRQQLWKFAPEEAKDKALIQTLNLESDLLDEDTIQELPPLIRRWKRRPGRRSHWVRLWELADSPKHSLNAEFLHTVLSGQDVAERDLSWSEWTRSNAETLVCQLQHWSSDWAKRAERGDADDLRARSVAWLLTSTNRTLRDTATQTLKHFGSPEPARLLKLAITMIDVNDPYVVERVLAACFGSVAAHQMPEPASSLMPSLHALLERLNEKFIELDASSPTWNINIRSYTDALIEYTSKLQPGALPAAIDPSAYGFQPAGKPAPASKDGDEGYEADHAMHMDFSNYTLGYLFPNRPNYDFENIEYALGAAEVRKRIWDLGWRKDRFGSIDKTIAEQSYGRQGIHGATERYGKKYGWIAYFELAGRRHSQGALRSSAWDTYRGVTPDIDPTFPEQPAQLSIEIPSWSASSPELSTPDWLRGGQIDVPDQVLRSRSLDVLGSDFLLIEGHLEHKSDNGRKVWGFARSFLVEAADAETLVQFLSTEEYLGNDLIPRCPSPADCFAGEMPWSRNYEIVPAEEQYTSAYSDTIEIADRIGIRIELLAQNYSASGYESNLGLRQGEFSVPSLEICRHAKLHGTPSGLDFVDTQGRLASATRLAPSGWSGDVMYLRQDLLAEYAKGRKIIQLVWGEREPPFELFSSTPRWVREAYQTHANLWRHIEIADLGEA